MVAMEVQKWISLGAVLVEFFWYYDPITKLKTMVGLVLQ